MFILIIGIFLIGETRTFRTPVTCDNTPVIFNEGVLGQTKQFPWVGALYVKLYDIDTVTIALTGLILVQKRFAIANADDIARIPRRIFKEHSKALFILDDNKKSFYELLDYMTHPEYGKITYNSIAIIELIVETGKGYNLRPICWTLSNFIESQLYAFAITDVNKKLEKEAYKLFHFNNTFCSHYYDKEGLSPAMMVPTHPVCGIGLQMDRSCVWDNGMVLATNSTGPWQLIGLGIRGPGCAAPSRFINLYPYFDWIEKMTTSPTENNISYRRHSALGEGFKITTPSSYYDEIPAHDYLREWRENTASPESYKTMEAFQPEFYRLNFHKLLELKKMSDRLGISFSNRYENKTGDCLYKTLVYREKSLVKAPTGQAGRASYVLSLYDIAFKHFNCIMLRIESLSRGFARLTTTKFLMIENNDELVFETPEFLLKKYNFSGNVGKNRGQDLATTDPNRWQPNPRLTVKFLEDKYDYTQMPFDAMNLYVNFEFQEEAMIHLLVYSQGKPLTTTNRNWLHHYYTRGPIQQKYFMALKNFTTTILPDAPYFPFTTTRPRRRLLNKYTKKRRVVINTTRFRRRPDSRTSKLPIMLNGSQIMKNCLTLIIILQNILQFTSI